MNDRFRFRVWGISRKKFENKKAVEDARIGFLPKVSSNYVVEQCTSLKDKNGKLIYEGDIIRVFYDHFNGTFTEKEVVGPVKWECGTWVVNNSFLHHSPEYDETHLESAAVEVIGNIHENPELLEVKNDK